MANIVGMLQQVSAEERMPVDCIKQRLTVLDAELKKLEQDGCRMEDRIRSCLCFRIHFSLSN